MKSLTLSIGVILGLTTALAIEWIMYHNINYLLLKVICIGSLGVLVMAILIVLREQYKRIMKQK